MTLPAPVKQAHIARALREAKKAKAKRVRIEADGAIEIILDGEGAGEPVIEEAPPGPGPKREDKPPKVEIKPKKKVRLS